MKTIFDVHNLKDGNEIIVHTLLIGLVLWNFMMWFLDSLKYWNSSMNLYINLWIKIK
jgi:hypothetical protein